MPALLSIRPFSRWKKLIPCHARKYCLFVSIMSLLAISMVLLITHGYHAGFKVINHLGSLLPDQFWSSVTLLGDTRLSLVLLLFFIYRYPLLLPAALMASIPATLISHGFKYFINAPRPVVGFGVDNINQIGDLLRMGSFPSGHSTSVGVFFGLILMLSHNVMHRRILLLTMILVGVSRVMVGAHYPIDVFVGLSLGLISASFGLYMTNRFQLMRHPLSQWLMLPIPFIAVYLVFQHDGGYPQGELFAKAITVIAVMAYFHWQLSVHSFYRHDVRNTLVGDAINLAKIIRNLALSAK